MPIAAVFQRIRVGAPLSADELARLGVADDHELARRLQAATAGHTASLVARAGGDGIRFGWQHAVHLGPDTVVKTLATHPASEYLTDESTLAAVADALHAAGGLVPATSQLLGEAFVSARLSMLIQPGTDTMSPLFGGRPVPDSVLPPGWLDEQIRLHLQLMRQGVLNFDTKFKDLGVDEHGVLQIADFSTFQQLHRYRPGSPRTDVFRLAVNELVRNGQYLSRFANGQQLQQHWAHLVRSRLGLDLRPYFDGWEWGDQAGPRVAPLAGQLRRVAHRLAHGARPRPVYPVLDSTAERLTVETLADLAAGPRRRVEGYAGA